MHLDDHNFFDKNSSEMKIRNSSTQNSSIKSKSQTPSLPMNNTNFNGMNTQSPIKFVDLSRTIITHVPGLIKLDEILTDIINILNTTKTIYDKIKRFSNIFLFLTDNYDGSKGEYYGEYSKYKDVFDSMKPL